MTDELRMNLGALRSDMQLTLHTHHASRIWRGRPRSEGHPGIIGLSGFVGIMSTMRRGSELDDPYSDWWMLRIEEKLDDTKKRLQALRQQVDQVLADIPADLTLGENLNVQPVKLPLFIHAQLGFLAVYLLADYDQLARRVILAHHTALIDRRTLDLWINEGAHLLRSTFSLAQRYRYSGASRDDFAANNAVARVARETLGEPPQDVLEGTRRSRFAPPTRRSGLRDGATAAAPPPNETSDPTPDGAVTDEPLPPDLTDDEDAPA